MISPGLLLDGSSLVFAFRRFAVRAGLWGGFGAQYRTPLLFAGERIHISLPGEMTEPCLGCGRSTERVGCNHHDYMVFGASGSYSFCRSCLFYFAPPRARDSFPRRRWP